MGKKWYDLRNRFYSPDIGRFLQPDPTGFNGDPTSLYRYCGNNPLKWRDPLGLQEVTTVEGVTPEIIVSAPYISPYIVNFDYNPTGPNFLGAQAPSNLIPWNWMIGSRGWYFGPGRGIFGYGPGGIPFRLPEDDQPSVEHPLPSSVPSQNPDPNGWWNFFSGGPSWDPFYKFMSSTDATAEQKAWTDTGRLPTLILGGIVLAPFAAPETGLYAATAIYNALVTGSNLAASGTNVAVTGANAAASWTAYQIYVNPGPVLNATQYMQGFFFYGAPPQSRMQAYGSLTREAWVAWLMYGHG